MAISCGLLGIISSVAVERADAIAVRLQIY